MVELTDKYLTAAFVKKLPDKNFEVTGPGREDMLPQRDGKEALKLVIPIKLSDGKAHDWIPNETSKKSMRKKWGDNTEQWTGKKDELIVVEQNVRGDMTDVIYVKK